MAFLKESRVTTGWGNLTLIENLLSIMKKKLKDDHTIISLNNMQDAITKMWVLLPNNIMKKLKHSMARRLRMCIVKTKRDSSFVCDIEIKYTFLPWFWCFLVKI
jgi:hypothetical protein